MDHHSLFVINILKCKMGSLCSNFVYNYRSYTVKILVYKDKAWILLSKGSILVTIVSSAIVFVILWSWCGLKSILNA